jgi:protein involved in polysaccharide export with SLBB domain
MEFVAVGRGLATSIAMVCAVICGGVAGGPAAMAQDAAPRIWPEHAALRDLAPQHFADAGEYRLMPGDQVAITLPLNPELNSAGPIGPDGRFAMPLAGGLRLGGLTADEAQALVARALRERGIVADARPSVAVSLYGASVYVGGEVRNPGEVALLKAPNAMQAVILAGGMLDTARTRRIAIITPSATGPARVRTVDLRAYSRRGKAGSVASGPILSPGEIVFVPKSAIAEVDLWIDQHINRVIPTAAHFNYNTGGGGVTTTTVTP